MLHQARHSPRHPELLHTLGHLEKTGRRDMLSQPNACLTHWQITTRSHHYNLGKLTENPIALSSTLPVPSLLLYIVWQPHSQDVKSYSLQTGSFLAWQLKGLNLNITYEKSGCIAPWPTSSHGSYEPIKGVHVLLEKQGWWSTGWFILLAMRSITSYVYILYWFW